jgi:putative phage-type endonuclease
MNPEERNKYIGGSDCAAILGLSRWKSPLQIWGEKTGIVPAEDISQKISVKMGLKLEDAVADLFTEQTGKKVRRSNITIFMKEYPFIGANLDRSIVGEDAILEVKTTSVYASKEWQGEEMPREYILQVLHYLAVTGEKKGYLAVLIGNNDFKIKEIERDEKLIKDIIEKEVYFWNEFIVPKKMPTMITAKDGDMLYSLYPLAESGKTIELTDEASRICETLDGLLQDKRTIESQIEQNKNLLKAMVKENEIGITPMYQIKWQNIHKESYIVKATNYRQISYKKL